MALDFHFYWKCRVEAGLLAGTGLRVIFSGRILVVIMFLRRVCGRNICLAYALWMRNRSDMQGA